MNNGTIIRTTLAIATCLNTALMATDVAQFHNPSLDLAYRILSVILNFIIVACATWYNNDFTEVAAEKTGEMRQKKAELKAGYVGEQFFSDTEDAEDPGDEEEPVYGELGEALTEEDGDVDAHEDI